MQQALVKKHGANAAPPILLRVYEEGGHFAGCSEDAIAEEYAFIIAALQGG